MSSNLAAKGKLKISSLLPKKQNMGRISTSKKEELLAQTERRLNLREIALIERELLCMHKQDELVRMKPLSGLYRVVKAMAKERKLEALLEVITVESQAILDCDRLSVFVLDEDEQILWTQIAQGMVNQRVISVPLSGTSIASECARTGRIVNIEDAYKDKRFEAEIDKQTGYRTKSVLCVPMLNRNGVVIGVLQALNKAQGAFSSQDEEWLESLTAVAANLIEQAKSYAEIERFVDKTLETLAQTIDKRDPLTAGHSMRVTKYSLLLGGVLRIKDEEVDVLRYAAMMHDYGKIGVPEAVLWKPGRLTPDEYSVVQKHARITFDLLSNLPFTHRLRTVPFVASCHHEKLDGTGYYRGLKGDDIPYLARLIAVADVFDALTSERHYRNRMPIDKVHEIMQSGRHNHFEPDCVDALYRLPCHQVLAVMESERGLPISGEVAAFRSITWQRLVELVCLSKPKRGEEGLKDTFERLYNAGLPADYQALD
jgi:HD-GYP domain-containing protein (c-di-GMP phosphodiesterase class II)